MLLRRVFWLFGLLIATGAFTPAPSAAQSMNWCRLANPQTCVPGNIRTTFILPTRAPQIWVLPLRRFEKIKEDAEAEGLAPATVAFGRRVVQLISARAILVTSTGTDVDLFFKDNASGAFANAQLFGSGNGTANHRYSD